MLRITFLLLLITVFASAVSAADTVWSGATNASWNNAGNWSAGIPGAGDTAIFDGTGTLPAAITGASGSLQAIEVIANTDIDVEIQTNGALTLTGGQDGAVIVTGGNTLTIANSGANDVNIEADIQIEDGAFTINNDLNLGNGSSGTFIEIFQNDGDLSFGNVTVVEVVSASTGDSTDVEFIRETGGTGTLTVSSLIVEGDTSDDATGQEEGSGRVRIGNCDVSVTGSIQLDTGSGSAGEEGRGAELDIEGSTVSIATNLVVGSGTATNENSAADLEISQSSTITFASGGLLSVTSFCSCMIVESTVTGSGAYTVQSVLTASSVLILNSTITAQTAGDLTVSLGATQSNSFGIALLNSDFSNYDSAGVQFISSADVLALNECNFTNGQSGGSHITFNGLGTNSTSVADLCQFDLSTGTGTTAWVNVASTTELLFRVGSGQDFGFGAASVDATTAETYDNDGTSLPPVNVVAWADVFSVLTVSMTGNGQPTGLDAATTADQPLVFFDLDATIGNSQVTDVEVELEFDDSQSTNFDENDVQTVTLFNDANSNGQLDTGEDIDSVAGGTTTATFASLTEVLNQGTTETWGIAITFASSVVGKSGRVSMFILPTIGIVTQDPSPPNFPGIVGGLPLVMEDSIPVHGAPDALALWEEPGDAHANVAFGDQPLVVVVDSNGEECGLDNTTVITPSIQTDPVGGSALIGSEAAGITVTNGRAQFTNLGIDTPGSGFQLRFTAAPAPTTSSTVDSGLFDVAAPPPEINVERVTGTSIPDNTGTDDVGNRSTLSNVVLTYTILNAGPGTLNVGSVTFPGTPTNCTPSLSSAPGATVAPSNSTTFEVTVSLAGPVAFDFEISIANDDPNENPYNFTVQGNGIEPNVEVRYNSITVGNGGGHTVTGAVAATAINVQYTIVNTGTEALTLDPTPVSASVGTTSGNCTIGTITQPSTLTLAANGGSTTFAVQVTPTAAGAFDFDVSVGSNDPDDDPYDFTGDGTAAAAPEPEIDVLRGGSSIPSGNTDNLSNLLQGSLTPFSWDIENTGSADLTISNTTLSAQTNCTAVVSSAPAGTVNAGGSTLLTVDITPSAASFSFTITITNNDSDEGSYVVNVSGTASATAPEINVQRSGTDIADAGTDDVGSHAAGTPVTFTYTIQNTGTAVLNLGASSVSVSNAVGCTVTVTTQPGTTVATSASDTFDVEVTPAGGAFSFEIAISNDDANENPYNISVIGNQGGSGGGGGGGGDDDGGCSTGGSTTWLWLALLALAAGRVILRRRDA